MLNFFADACDGKTGALLEACQGAGTIGENGGLPDSLTTIIGNVSTVLFFVIGLLAVAILVYGGIQYILSEGNASKIERAKTTITWAIAGLLISILSWVLVHFIIINVRGNVTTTDDGSGGGITPSSPAEAPDDEEISPSSPAQP